MMTLEMTQSSSGEGASNWWNVKATPPMELHTQWQGGQRARYFPKTANSLVVSVGCDEGGAAGRKSHRGTSQRTLCLKRSSEFNLQVEETLKVSRVRLEQGARLAGAG